MSSMAAYGMKTSLRNLNIYFSIRLNISSVDVIEKGMRCLSENMGAMETELFIATLLRERFDYTKWRSSLVDSVKTFADLDKFVKSSCGVTKFSGNPKVVL